jgi:outer membrane protein OmpA-like peptidoglycan-associated protein
MPKANRMFKTREAQGEERMKKGVIYGLIVALVAMNLGCAEMNRTQKGAVIGAAGGAAVGGLIGKAAGSTVAGVLIGAAVGGAAGGIIGNYMDKQAAEIQRDIAGASVERIGEGIKITFDSNVMFDVDQSRVKDGFKAELTELAAILNKYEDTNILLQGHTDATGPEEYNLALSRRRAQAVADYLSLQAVDSARFTIEGYGESMPVASNDTPEGRRQNRRVEVAIWANEELKKAATERAG